MPDLQPTNQPFSTNVLITYNAPRVHLLSNLPNFKRINYDPLRKKKVLLEKNVKRTNKRTNLVINHGKFRHPMPLRGKYDSHTEWVSSFPAGDRRQNTRPYRPECWRNIEQFNLVPNQNYIFCFRPKIVFPPKKTSHSDSKFNSFGQGCRFRSLHGCQAHANSTPAREPDRFVLMIFKFF